MNSNNKSTDLNFIKLVKSYPIIYDKEHSRGQKNSLMKNEAWSEIAQIFKKSEVACITRWKSIRDRFGKEFRRQQENAQDTTNWELFPHLLFLKDHYKQGSARNDSIEGVRYQPRVRKRKPNRGEDCGDGEGDEEICPEELTLNQNIISLVKQHDVLYDRKRVRDSKNLAAKNEAWTVIANSLDVTEEICYMKWKKLRDRFSREYRQFQLYPERPITWIYFNDLRFLESHYRKGIPLPVDEIKRKVKCSPDPNENPWGEDLTKSLCYSENEDNHHDHDPDSDDLITEETLINNMPEQPFDDFIYMQPKKQCLSNDNSEASNIQVTYHVTQDMTSNPVSQTSFNSNVTTTHTSVQHATLSESLIPVTSDAEEKLHNVISNMECVLKQSHDCLRAVQNQKEHYRNELLQRNNTFNMQPQMLDKVNMLLDGLLPEQRNKAERKILQFLCECQIKTLNNEEINDVAPVNIY